MTHQSLLDPLIDLLVQSQALLQLGQEKNWEQLEAGVKAYENNMLILNDATYLQSLKDANQEVDALNLIVQIQTLHQELDSLADEGYETIASELRQIIQSDKAIGAYRR